MMEHISPIVANNLPKSVFNILITYNKRYIIFDILGKRLQHSFQLSLIRLGGMGATTGSD